MVLSTVKHSIHHSGSNSPLFKRPLYFTSQWLTQKQEELPAVENRKKWRTQQNFMTEIWVIFTLHGFVSCCPELFHPAVFHWTFLRHACGLTDLCYATQSSSLCSVLLRDIIMQPVPLKGSRWIVYCTFSWFYSKGHANLFDFTHTKH